MSRNTLLRMMARGGKSRTAAADELDRTVEHILRALRGGKPVRLPGMGDLVPDEREHQIRFIPGRDGKGDPK